LKKKNLLSSVSNFYQQYFSKSIHHGLQLIKDHRGSNFGQAGEDSYFLKQLFLWKAKCKEIFKLKVGKDVSAILTGAHRIFI
jgi:hypothetical protein